MTRRWVALFSVLCWTWTVGPAMAQDGKSATANPREAAKSSEASPSGSEALDSTSSPKDLPQTTVLKTQVPSGDDATMGRTVERSVRAHLDELDVVETKGSPGLGLRDLQLAVGCTADTNTCLKVVAEKLETGALLLSSVERVDESLVLTLTFFDATTNHRKETVRRAQGDDASGELLDSVKAQLHKVLGLPPPESAQASAATRAVESKPGAAKAQKPERGPSDPTWSPYPFVVGGAGVVALVTATILGVRSKRVEDDYANADAQTKTQVDGALDDFERADRLGKSANALFGIGGALAVGGTALFFVLERDALFDREQESSQAKVKVAPTFSDHSAGLLFRGAL